MMIQQAILECFQKFVKPDNHKEPSFFTYIPVAEVNALAKEITVTLSDQGFGLFRFFRWMKITQTFRVTYGFVGNRHHYFPAGFEQTTTPGKGICVTSCTPIGEPIFDEVSLFWNRYSDREKGNLLGKMTRLAYESASLDEEALRTAEQQLNLLLSKLRTE